MELQTKIPLQPERDLIDYGSKVLLMGSCFVENIGQKLDYYQFLNLQNPFGIVFHPIAIEKLITRAINKDHYTEKDVMFINEQWFCLETHSSMSNSNKEELLAALNNNLKKLHEYVLSASHIIFTYGTAWVYRFLETDTVVANCHKIPQKKFLKELLSVEEIEASIENTYTLIRSVNPKSRLIQTVSPVRHLKDGFIENTRSKAHLIAAIHELVNPTLGLHYFPSYEIMMDELRDYRFYTEDMLHPNSTATSIIWERFSTTWISLATTELQKEIETVQTGLEHRPFRPTSEAHQLFKNDLQKKIEKLRIEIPHLKL